MSDPLATEAKSLFKSIRVVLAVSGAIALIAGIVLLVWPLKSAVIVTGIFATYLVIAGLVYIGLGIFSKVKGGWARVGHIVLGLVYIVAGVIAFANLGVAAATLALVVVIFIGISWIVDGVVALSLLGQDGSRVWTLLYALLSIIAGIVVLFSRCTRRRCSGWCSASRSSFSESCRSSARSPSARTRRSSWPRRRPTPRSDSPPTERAPSIRTGLSLLEAETHSASKALTSPTNRVLSAGTASTAARAISAANSDTL